MLNQKDSNMVRTHYLFSLLLCIVGCVAAMEQPGSHNLKISANTALQVEEELGRMDVEGATQNLANALESHRIKQALEWIYMDVNVQYGINYIEGSDCAEDLLKELLQNLNDEQREGLYGQLTDDVVAPKLKECLARVMARNTIRRLEVIDEEKKTLSDVPDLLSDNSDIEDAKKILKNLKNKKDVLNSLARLNQLPVAAVDQAMKALGHELSEKDLQEIVLMRAREQKMHVAGKRNSLRNKKKTKSNKKMQEEFAVGEMGDLFAVNEALIGIANNEYVEGNLAIIEQTSQSIVWEALLYMPQFIDVIEKNIAAYPASKLALCLQGGRKREVVNELPIRFAKDSGNDDVGHVPLDPDKAVRTNIPDLLGSSQGKLPAGPKPSSIKPFGWVRSMGSLWVNLGTLAAGFGLYKLLYPEKACPFRNLATCQRWEFKKLFNNKDYEGAYNYFMKHRTTMGFWLPREIQEFESMATQAVHELIHEGNEKSYGQWLLGGKDQKFAMWYIAILRQLIKDPHAYPKAEFAHLIQLLQDNKLDEANQTIDGLTINLLYDLTNENKQALCQALAPWEHKPAGKITALYHELACEQEKKN